MRANSDNVCISGAGWADAGYSGSRFVKMSALLRIGLKLAWARHLKLQIFLMHWSEFSINLSSALSLLKCLGLGVMKMMNRAIKIMFRREKCIIYHYCLIAALNIQTILTPLYQVNQPLIQNVICGYFLQPSLVTTSPDLNRPGSVLVKKSAWLWYEETITLIYWHWHNI